MSRTIRPRVDAGTFNFVGIRVIVPEDELTPWVEVKSLCDYLGIRFPDTLRRACDGGDPLLELGFFEDREYATIFVAAHCIKASGRDLTKDPFALWFLSASLSKAAMKLHDELAEVESPLADGHGPRVNERAGLSTDFTWNAAHTLRLELAKVDMHTGTPLNERLEAPEMAGHHRTAGVRGPARGRLRRRLHRGEAARACGACGAPATARHPRPRRA